MAKGRGTGAVRNERVTRTARHSERFLARGRNERESAPAYASARAAARGRIAPLIPGSTQE